MVSGMYGEEKPKKKKPVAAVAPIDPTIEKTKKYTDGIKAYDKNVTSPNMRDTTQGIDINKASAKSTAVPYSRQTVVTGTGTGSMTKIIGDDKKTVVYEGRTDHKDTAKAISDSDKHVADTNQRRGYNSDFRNLNSGANPNPDAAGKEKLVALQKAVVVNDGGLKNAKEFIATAKKKKI